MNITTLSSVNILADINTLYYQKVDEQLEDILKRIQDVSIDFALKTMDTKENFQVILPMKIGRNIRKTTRQELKKLGYKVNLGAKNPFFYLFQPTIITIKDDIPQQQHAEEE